MSLRDKIMAADDLPRETVEVPEWGVSVYLRCMTAAERDALERNWTASKNLPNPNFRAQVVARCMVDEAGQRVFDDASVVKLGEKSGIIVDRLFDRCLALCGMRAADVESAEKNSRIPTPADSPSV